jgi:diguanylate cyclase (GGDEF)-like protein
MALISTIGTKSTKILHDPSQGLVSLVIGVAMFRGPAALESEVKAPYDAARIMGQLGLFWTTAIMTCLSALMSTGVASVIGLILTVPDFRTHIILAFVIPFFVTPPFSYLTALSLRSSQRARRRASHMADHDALTGLANRRVFFELAGKPPKRGMRAVLYIDLDRFKSINDQYGHAAGDVVLKEFALLLTTSVRATDVAARIGGEEFAVYLDDIPPYKVAEISERILSRCRAAAVPHNGRLLRFTASIGVATGDRDISLDALLTAADQQLYAVKHSGRNNYRMTAVTENSSADVAAEMPHDLAAEPSLDLQLPTNVVELNLPVRRRAQDLCNT